MNKQPLLSVIVPVYNTEKYLDRCMDSLLKQDYSALEIILIDDGSKEECAALCDEWAEKQNNIVVLHKKNAGLGFARNSGIELAKGEYVAFLDSDDFIEREMYSEMMKNAVSKNADVVYCNFVLDKNDGSRVKGMNSLREGLYTGKEILRYIIGSEPDAGMDYDFDMSVWKAVFRKEILVNNHILFKSERHYISEDLIFDIEILPLCSRIYYMNQSFYHYCENAGSLTHRYIKNRLEKEIILYEYAEKMLAKVFGEIDYRTRFDRLFLGRVRSCIRQEVVYEGKRGIRSKLDGIRKISNDKLVRKIIEKYPYQLNPLKLRLFHFCLQKRYVFLMYLLIRVKR